MNQFDFVEYQYSARKSAVVMKNGLWGLIDKNGNVLIQPKYDCIREFCNGFAAVQQNDLWGFIDETGREIVSPKYTNVTDFYPNNIAIVSLSDGHNIIDTDGKELLQGNYQHIKATNHSILFICNINRYWHIYNAKDDELKVLPDISGYTSLDEYYIVRNSQNYVGLLDSEGNLIIKCENSSIDKLSERFFTVYNCGACSIFDTENNTLNYVGNMKIDSVVESNNEVYLTYYDENDKIRFIETTNYMPWLNKYCDSIIDNFGGKLKVKLNGKTGYLYL